ncbi:hypothetical protein DFH09DRAFT_1193417 [Mycena vulgaris]|nr:hypothetical protein DFH09DRAFT_1193417 [Mycena vulgaris]
MSGVLSPLSPALMSFTCVTNAYRLVVVLSFVQLTSGIATIALYGIDGGVFNKVIQLAQLVYAVLTVALMYHMLRYTHRAGTNILSRVEGQYYFLIYLTRTYCIPAEATSARCASIGADTVLPPGIIVAVYSALQALRRRAVAMHGTQMVPTLQPPATLIPAWMVPHVSELRQEHESTAKSAIATHIV